MSESNVARVDLIESLKCVKDIPCKCTAEVAGKAHGLIDAMNRLSQLLGTTTCLSKAQNVVEAFGAAEDILRVLSTTLADIFRALSEIETQFARVCLNRSAQHFRTCPPINPADVSQDGQCLRRDTYNVALAHQLLHTAITECLVDVATARLRLVVEKNGDESVDSPSQCSITRWFDAFASFLSYVQTQVTMDSLLGQLVTLHRFPLTLVAKPSESPSA